MDYAKTFVAETQKAAMALAQEFLETLDSYTQPKIWGEFERNGEWHVTVKWYGLD